MFHANETTVPIPGGTADVISFGTGERPLVMLPGLRLSGIRGGAGAVSWYYRRFARAFTVYLIDRRDPVLPGCTIHDLADDTAAAMHQLDLRDVCLYGASQGGMIAQDLTISFPSWSPASRSPSPRAGRTPSSRRSSPAGSGSPGRRASPPSPPTTSRTAILRRILKNTAPSSPSPCGSKGTCRSSASAPSLRPS